MKSSKLVALLQMVHGLCVRVSKMTTQRVVISKNSASVDRVVVVWPNVAESTCSCPVHLQAETGMKKDVTTGKGSLLSCSFGARCKSWPDSFSHVIVLSQFSSPNIFIKPMGLVCVFFFSSFLGGRHCKLQRGDGERSLVPLHMINAFKCSRKTCTAKTLFDYK